MGRLGDEIDGRIKEEGRAEETKGFIKWLKRTVNYQQQAGTF